MAKSLPQVVKVIDEFRIVINSGRKDGVEYDDRFLVYEVGEELFDPETDESLGNIEIVKGRGKPRHIQDQLTTLESVESERVLRRGALGALAFGSEYQTRELPFNDPKTGDIARRLKEPDA